MRWSLIDRTVIGLIVAGATLERMRRRR